MTNFDICSLPMALIEINKATRNWKINKVTCEINQMNNAAIRTKI